MFLTATKTAIVEALVSGFQQLASGPSNTSLDLVPNSITIEYPLQQVLWPAIFVQFRPDKVQWTGLMPDQYTTAVSGSVTTSRMGYFEGSVDLQIMAMHSEERDKLWDSVVNLVLMGAGSPASTAFYDSIANNDLVSLTFLPDTVTPLGDTVSPGTPFSPEELTYEASVRLRCIGTYSESKYNYPSIAVDEITVSGTLTLISGAYVFHNPYAN